MRSISLYLAACAALALVAVPADAMQRPDLVLTAGSNTAVDGKPGDGGLSTSIAAMWAVDSPLSVGLMAFADDCGTDLGRLRDMHDGADLGSVELRHRFAYGGAWRFDVALPAVARWAPFVSATWGAYRIQDDVRGRQLAGTSSTGYSLGAGVRRSFLGSGSLGLSTRLHRVERGPSKGWLNAGLDWQWRLGRRP